MIDSDLYEPYDKLIEIEVEGRSLRVPENNRLLRCFQFLAMRAISYGDFCWNGDCTNCQFWYREPGQQASDPDKTALACRFRVREGLQITRLDPCIRLDTIDEEIVARDSNTTHAPEDTVAPKQGRL
ncbi:MAG: hypothetical protein QOE33_3127 [Acidobacteriota bacterium]|nr:hypothetical protein [Acidobacteriota bacterium]